MGVVKRKRNSRQRSEWWQWISEWWQFQPPPFRLIIRLSFLMSIIAIICFVAEAYYIVHPYHVSRQTDQATWSIDYPLWLLWGQQSELRLFVFEPLSEDLAETELEIVIPLTMRVDHARLRPPPTEVQKRGDSLYLRWSVAVEQLQPGKGAIIIPLINDQQSAQYKSTLYVNGEIITIYSEPLWLERIRQGVLKVSAALGLGSLLAALFSSWHFHQQRNERQAREKVAEARKILRQTTPKHLGQRLRQIVEEASHAGWGGFWRSLPERTCIEFLKGLLNREIRLQLGDSIPCPWSEWATEISRVYVAMIEESGNEDQADGNDTEVQLVSWLLQQDWRVLNPDVERDLRDTIADLFSQITSQYEWRQWKTRLDTRRPETIERDTIAEMPNLFPEPELRAEDLTTRWWLFAKGLFWKPDWLPLAEGPSAAFNLLWGPAGQGHTAAALAVGRYRNPPQALGLYFRQTPTLSRVQRALAEQVLEFLMARAPDLWRLDRAQRTLLWHWLASVLPVASILARLESARQAWWGRASGEQMDVDGEDHIRARYADAVLRVCQAEVPEFRAWAPLPDDAWWAEGRTVLDLLDTRLAHSFQAVWIAWDDPRDFGASRAEEVPWLSLRDHLQTMGLDLRVWWFVPSEEEPSLPHSGAPAWQRIPMRWAEDDLRGLLGYRLQTLGWPKDALGTVYDPEIVAWWLRERSGCTLRDFARRWQAAWQEVRQKVERRAKQEDGKQGAKQEGDKQRAKQEDDKQGAKQEDNDAILSEHLKKAFRDQFARWERCA